MSHLLHESVSHYLAGERSGHPEDKNRGEVAGSGKKLCRQKGTGRARNVRCAARCGGMAARAGTRPRVYSHLLNKK